MLCEAEGATLLHTSRRDDRAEFSHQLVQEFFAAYSLRHDPAEAIRHVRDLRWWQSLLMLVGLVRDPMPFVRDVLGDGTDGQQTLLAAVLLQCVDQTDECVVSQVSEALAQTIGETVSVEQRRAVAELVVIAPSIIAKVLGDRLRLGNTGQKRAVFGLVGDIGGRWAAEIVADWQILLDPTIRDLVERLCATIGQPAVEPLIAVVGSEAPISMLERVEGTIARIGGQAVEPLLAALRDGNVDVRRAAAEALARIGHAWAVEPPGSAAGQESTETGPE